MAPLKHFRPLSRAELILLIVIVPLGYWGGGWPLALVFIVSAAVGYGFDRWHS